MLNRITRGVCSKQLLRRATATAGVRLFGGSALNDPSLQSAPGGYPELKFRKDVNDYIPRTNEDEAHFCGRKPGTPMEGWEFMYGVVMLGMLGALVGMYFQDDTTLEVSNLRDFLLCGVLPTTRKYTCVELYI